VASGRRWVRTSTMCKSAADALVTSCTRNAVLLLFARTCAGMHTMTDGSPPQLSLCTQVDDAAACDAAPHQCCGRQSGVVMACFHRRTGMGRGCDVYMSCMLALIEKPG